MVVEHAGSCGPDCQAAATDTGSCGSDDGDTCLLNYDTDSDSEDQDDTNVWAGLSAEKMQERLDYKVLQIQKDELPDVHHLTDATIQEFIVKMKEP